MSKENIRVMTTPKGTKYFVNRSYILTMFNNKQNIYEKILFIEYVINLQNKYETLLAIEELNEEKIKRVACNLGHELYGHILQNDEESYNEEFYTDGKLDYKKLLIRLLEQTFETLEVDGKKWWDYEN